RRASSPWAERGEPAGSHAAPPRRGVGARPRGIIRPATGCRASCVRDCTSPSRTQRRSPMPLASRLPAFAAAILAAFAFTGPAQAQTEVKLAYALAVNSHYGAGAKAWAETAEKLSNGKLVFKHFPS